MFHWYSVLYVVIDHVAGLPRGGERSGHQSVRLPSEPLAGARVLFRFGVKPEVIQESGKGLLALALLSILEPLYDLQALFN